MLHIFKNLIFCIALLLGGSVVSQSDNGIIGAENWLTNWTNFKPKQIDYRDVKIILTGQIKNSITLTRDNTYLLVGDVYVTNNAVLTIEAGTVIRGDYDSNGTLIVTKNSKILANGTDTNPIIFTSNINGDRKAGDWGGVIVLGDAPINKSEGVGCVDIALKSGLCKFGGTNEKSNSGVLNFVRIEFAGKKFNKEKGLNALTLAGVGSDTKVSNIQISYANDDAIEIKGGLVNMSKIVSFKSFDDDFDLSMGTQLTIDNTLIIRDPFLSENSGSRAFEVESFDKLDYAEASRKLTSVIVSNVTVLNIEKDDYVSNKEAIFISDESKFHLKNSVLSGFGSAFALTNQAAISTSLQKNIMVTNVFCNSCTNLLVAETSFSENLNFSSEIEKTIFTKNNHFTKLKMPLKAIFRNADYKYAPDYRLLQNQNFVAQ